MFRKENRLNKQRDFDRLFKEGRSSFDKTLGVKAASNQLDRNRFGVIVSNKVSKKAVERNKIKRRIREIIKQHATEIKEGVDLAVITLPPSRDKTFAELEASFRQHLKRMKLLK